MASMFTKEKRIILRRRIGNFWMEFKSKRIGITGLSIVIFFVLVAICAPLLTSYDPIAKERIAQPFAKPEWVTIFPQYKDLPTTQNEVSFWNVEQGSEFVKNWGTTVTVLYDTKARGMETFTVKLKDEISYLSIPPNNFYVTYQWGTTQVRDVAYSLQLKIQDPEGKSYVLWTQHTTEQPASQSVYVDSANPFVITNLGYPTQTNIAKIIFSQKGDYNLWLEMRLDPLSENARVQLTLQEGELIILGQVHGVLGTDNVGADVFADLVWGTRISLLIGLLAAGVGTSIGILVGVAAGYLGGVVDEVTMRIVDILMCLPLLPLLLALVYIFGKNIFYIVLFIGVFGWQGLARVIRSQTLSLREMAYIETAKASGASGFYIISKHIVPNVMPVAFASMVLAVPGAILFEAALSFLGFGDPRVPTWGKMLQYSYGFGGFTRLAWWWIIPPGLAIITLCLAFVFMGYALDEIVNPRLRRRR
jgi:peptide/nickel transport system permease protein